MLAFSGSCTTSSAASRIWCSFPEALPAFALPDCSCMPSSSQPARPGHCCTPRGAARPGGGKHLIAGAAAVTQARCRAGAAQQPAVAQHAGVEVRGVHLRAQRGPGLLSGLRDVPRAQARQQRAQEGGEHQPAGDHPAPHVCGGRPRRAGRGQPARQGRGPSARLALCARAAAGARLRPIAAPGRPPLAASL